jgi:L-ascorbate metabolism protein UlaG (beta-lactamase superfamily)
MLSTGVEHPSIANRRILHAPAGHLFKAKQQERFIGPLKLSFAPVNNLAHAWIEMLGPDEVRLE